MTRRLSVTGESWPIAGSFTIARGSRTEAHVVVAEIAEAGVRGRGECVPYARYGETVDSVIEAITGLRQEIEAGMGRAALGAALPPGAARNALDCALWDLGAKRAGKRAAELAGIGALRPLTTAYTLSLGTPQAMFEAARAARSRPLLKVKLGGDGDGERIAAVRDGAPEARLIADANEAWNVANFDANMAACRRAGVVLVEQPLPAGSDALLAEADRPVPVCADESLHTAEDLEGLRARYDAVNIKLDKTGGLTEALVVLERAEALGFAIMVGCMVGTSLAMAPALLVAQRAAFVDLDGPLLLARDREHGLVYDGSLVSPPDPRLWG